MRAGSCRNIPFFLLLNKDITIAHKTKEISFCISIRVRLYQFVFIKDGFGIAKMYGSTTATQVNVDVVLLDLIHRLVYKANEDRCLFIFAAKTAT